MVQSRVLYVHDECVQSQNIFVQIFVAAAYMLKDYSVSAGFVLY